MKISGLVLLDLVTSSKPEEFIKKTVKTFLSYQASRELPYFKEIRKEVAEKWGDWLFIKNKVKDFPYLFYHQT